MTDATRNTLPPEGNDHGAELDLVLGVAFGGAARQPANPSMLRAIEAVAAVSHGSGRGEVAARSPQRRYVVQEELGQGGVGVVFEGRDLDLARTVALKVLREDRENDPEALRRFVDEARIGGRLEHPGIVPIYDLGLVDRGLPFLAMKLVQGRPLADALAERASPTEDLPRYLRVFERVCRAVAYAHAHDVLHRDLKPSNVMLGSFGEVQVVDWGLAKCLGGGGADAVGGLDTAAARESPPDGGTALGAVLGTPAYMPPEQARGRGDAQGPASDVFALGGMLCEILTGRPPYPGPPARALELAREGELDDASARLARCEAHSELVELCRHCLAADPDARPDDAGLVSQAIADHLNARERETREAEVAAARVRVRAREEQARAELEAQRAEGARTARRRTRTTAAVVLVALALASGLWLRRTLDDQAHVAQTTSASLAALREAEGHEAQGAYEAALALTHRAAFLAEGADLDAATREDLVRREARLAERVREEENRRRFDVADQALLADLEQVRRHGGRGADSPEAELDAAFEQTFGEHGLDVRQLTPEALGARIRERPGAARIAAYLDFWALMRRRLPGVAKASWGGLLDAAVIAHDDPWRRRVHAVAKGGDVDALRDLARETDVADVPVPTLLQVGLLLSEHGDRLATIDFLRRAQARHPGDFGLNDRLARLLQDRRQQSQRVESVACRVAAVAVDPTSGCAWSLLGQSLLAAGDSDRARAVCEHGRDLPPPHVDHILNLGNARFAAGDLDGALAAFELALEADPEFSEAAVNRAHALLKAGQAERALQVIEDVLAMHPNLETAHQIRARALSALGRRADAEAALRDALERLPKGARLYQTLGEMLGKRGDEAGVLDVLASGIDACPDAFALHFNRGNHLLAAERYEEALAAFSRAVELRNDDADAWNNRGVALRGLGRMAEAAEALRTAVALDPMYVAAISNLGGTLDDLNDLDAAIDAYLWAVELDPEFDEAWHNLGVTYMKQGRAEEAIRAFERSAAIDPESAITIYLIGVVHCDIQADFDAAIERFREAIAIDPTPAFFYIAQALAHRRKGDPLGAIPVLEEATRRNPKSVRAWSDLGGVCFEVERYDESIAAYERILAFAPQHVPSRVMLVRLLADCPDESVRRPEDAVTHSTLVCEAAADQAPAWVFHALALLRAGRAEEALDAIQKGADLQGRTGGRMLLLRSLAFAALGRVDEAAAAYDAAEEIFHGKTDVPPEVQRRRLEAAQVLGREGEGGGDE